MYTKLRNKQFATILILAAIVTCTLFGCKKEEAFLYEAKLETKSIESDESNSKIINYEGIDENLSRLKSVSSPITIGNSTVKIYSRNVGDEENHVVFKYGDLINRAISYKQEHPDTTVRIKFAMYRIGDASYVVFDPSHQNYGSVWGNDVAGESSEKLIWSLVKAAKNQVFIDFIFQKDTQDGSSACKADQSDNVWDYLNNKLDDTIFYSSSETVGDYLTVTRTDWTYDPHEQMHSKFMTVSHYDDGSNGTFNTVYVTSTNIDDHDGYIPISKDWVQTGTMVKNNPGLYNSHIAYFNILKNNYTSHSSFVSAVRTAHASNSLNYDDTYFSAYFFPIPSSPGGNFDPNYDDWSSSNASGWDENFNPFCKYAAGLANVRNGSRYVKTNMYHIKWDNLTEFFRDTLDYEYNNRNTSYTTNYKFLLGINSNVDDDASNNGIIPGTCKAYKDDYEDGIQRIRDEFDEMGATIKNQSAYTIGSEKKTHSKDMIFAYSEISEYYSITGSTNLKLDAVASKANHSLVIKEFTTSHPVYNEFKSVFEYQY